MEHYEIIDFHMHPGLESWQNMCAYGCVYEKSPEQLREEMKRTGISHICGSVIERQQRKADFAYLKNLNRDALKLRGIWGEFYTPGFHIHPEYVEESIEEIEFMHDNGVNLIGELVPYLHSWDGFETDSMQKILDVAEKYHMVVSYHSADYEVERMVSEHPGITFVAAHPGELPYVERHIERMKKYDNLYLDLSGTGLFRMGVLKYLVSQVGADRILFGTDYPICNPAMYVEAVKYEEITEKERSMILSSNAKRVLKLSHFDEK